MRILIRTLPLRSGNYGGILQAWALQQVLRDLGADLFVDISSRPGNRLSRTVAASLPWDGESSRGAQWITGSRGIEAETVPDLTRPLMATPYKGREEWVPTNEQIVNVRSQGFSLLRKALGL